MRERERGREGRREGGRKREIERENERESNIPDRALMSTAKVGHPSPPPPLSERCSVGSQ